jgi:hypothetical protein
VDQKNRGSEEPWVRRTVDQKKRGSEEPKTVQSILRHAKITTLGLDQLLEITLKDSAEALLSRS